MASNDILVFCPNGTVENGDLLSQAGYLADSQRLNGHQPGIARRELENKALRQATWMASALAQFIADKAGVDVSDSVPVAALATALSEAVVVVGGGSGGGTDPGGGTGGDDGSGGDLTAGTGIAIADGVISIRLQAGTGISVNGNTVSGNYTAGSGISISGNVISATGGSSGGGGGAPMPIDGGGDFSGTALGVWRGLVADASGAYLPSGGTWAFFYLAFYSSGGTAYGSGGSLRAAGVLPGGTKVWDPGNGTPAFSFGFCWRVA